jgi:putative copper resistance protein D
MDLLYFSMILFYWLFLCGVIFLAGAYGARVYVTGPSGAEICITGRTRTSLGQTVTRYIFLISILTLLVNAVHFILHCAVMTETPLQEIFSILPAFLTKTKYGRFTIVRSLLVAAIVVMSFVGMRQDGKGAVFAGTGISLLLLVAIAMSGHQGVMGYMNFPFFLDVLHLVAVSLWIGGIFFVRFFLSGFAKGGYDQFWEQMKALINRYSRLATSCVFIVVLSGILLAQAKVANDAALLHTDYGIVLLVKMILVAIIVFIGATNKFYVIPAINRRALEDNQGATRLGRKLYTLVTIEASLGFLILLLTSLLTHLSPEG